MTNFETQRKTWFDALMWLYSSITYRSLSVSDGLPFIVESRKSQLDVRNRTKVEQAVSCTFSSFSKTDYEPLPTAMSAPPSQSLVNQAQDAAAKLASTVSETLNLGGQAGEASPVCASGLIQTCLSSHVGLLTSSWSYRPSGSLY